MRAKTSLLRWIAVLSVLLAWALPQPAAGAERPNIVFIISDDQDFSHLGFMGNTHVHTPTLDRLAEEGTVFTCAHLPMSRCHPTLASFLSGRWPHQTGIYYNYGTKKLAPKDSLPNLLKKAGYATYFEGKYWEGDPRDMGFTHGQKTFKTFVRKGQKNLFAFLDDVAGKQPFFVWWAPWLPHLPHNPPEKYKKLFKRKDIPVPDWYKGDKKAFRQKEHLSFAMEAWLDDGVDQLCQKLKKLKVYDNTMFVFVIDNGWGNGLVAKGSPFEQGVRTPMFFTLPGTVPQGKRIDGLVSTLDLYPTILDYAGVPVPPEASGHDLRPTIEGKADATRDVLFGAIYPSFATEGDERPERDMYAIYMRTKRWKYIFYTQDVTEKRNQKYFRIYSILTDYPE
ncbi:MAG: sulfatase-like hydrolase/transferase, partial [Pirellulales bacterium]|nr:sulfatase-like hydrolase/transferase [Pirellulales bacterium]